LDKSVPHSNPDPSLADVVLPLPLFQSFTYTIPQDLQKQIRRGSRVLVPFGKKIATGIVIAFPRSSAVKSLKAIYDVFDSEPAVSDELLALSEWIAQYYCAPRGEVIKAFLPQGFSVESKRIVSLLRQPVSDKELSSLREDTKTKKIINCLQSVRSMTVSSLRKKTGIKAIYALLSKLHQLRIVEITEKIPGSGVKPKISKFVVKKITSPTVQVQGKNQARILERLQNLSSDPYSVQQLIKETHSTMSALKGLAKKGFLEIIVQEVERKPKTFFTEPETGTRIRPTPGQAKALDTINIAIASGTPQTFLLHGVTASGKTHVYIEAIRSVVDRGKSAIVLVPEISLTPQIVQRFKKHFGDLVIVMHSRMSAGERYDAWRLTRNGDYKIVIGPRSAVFAPVRDLGLIVVDEEHDSSYKQFDSSPRYNARDVAIVRARTSKASIILGSATPSIESYFNAQNGKYSLIEMRERVDRAVLPSITIVDMKEEHKRRYSEMKTRAKEIGKKAFEEMPHAISALLQEKIRDRLDRREGIILLQNRRGFAPFLECPECGYVDRCTQCDVTMTYHLSGKHLRCHYCGSVKPVPDVCPACSGIQLKLQGFGTQRIEQNLAELFPDARILRMDLDTTTKRGSHERLLQKFAHGEADILMGTQMVAKGLDFPRVTLVGVISADTQMLLPDFRSAERTFQLLTQVSGRAGRSTLRGEVIIQSYQTNHYSLEYVVEHNYMGFYQQELQFRKETMCPPYSRMALIEFQSTQMKNAEQAARSYVNFFTIINKTVSLLGPTPAVISKIKNNYRWHLVLKSDKARDPNGMRMKSAIMQALRQTEQHYKRGNVKIIVDIDPQGTM
jgi:primosomal protein N' (replication factor Y) (superfamily II helicase)